MKPSSARQVRLGIDVLCIALALLLLYAGGRWGWERRASFWLETAPVRFKGDVLNARLQTNNVLQLACRLATLDQRRMSELTFAQAFDGFRQTYDDLAERAERMPPIQREVRLAQRRSLYQLDYPPLRLAVMSLWNWNNARAGRTDVDYDDALMAPLLDFNAAMTVLAAGAALLIVYDVRRKTGGWLGGVGPALLLGSLAAVALWVCPAVIINSHGWPQWDVWVLPGFLWAVYLARTNRWACAGFCITFFAMLKGQLLLVALPLAIWPIVLLRFDWLLRYSCGLAAGAASVLWIWLVPVAWSWVWVVTAMIAVAAFMGMPARRRFKPWWWIAMILSAAIIVLPAVSVGAGSSILFALLAWSLLILPAAALWVRVGRSAFAVGTGAALVFVIGATLAGSWNWYAVGFPTNHHMTIAAGPNFNLPILLRDAYGWRIDDIVYEAPWAVRLNLNEPIELRRATWIGATFFLLLSGIALAVHHRRGDPRFLAAVVLPWAAVYLLLTQMHERYLTYVAASAALMLGLGLGGTLLYAAFALLASALMLYSMIRANGMPEDWQWLWQIVSPMQTAGSGSWAALTLGAVVAYIALTPTRRLREPPAVVDLRLLRRDRLLERLRTAQAARTRSVSLPQRPQTANPTPPAIAPPEHAAPRRPAPLPRTFQRTSRR